MAELTNAQRQYLRRLAHELRPIVQIGKQGLSDQAMATIDRALDAHELIKVKFLSFQDEKHELSQTMSDQLGAVLVSLIGNVATLYRRQSDPEKQQIALPRSANDAA